MEETTTPEHFTPAPEPEKNMLFSEEAQYYLQIAAKWSKFLSILGFIGSALMVIGGAFAGSFISKMSSMSAAMSGSTPMPPAMGGFLGFIYVILGALYFMPALYLYQFSEKAKSGILFFKNDDITTAMSKLKSFFKFFGIVAIVFLSLYALIIIGVLVFAGTYSAFRQ
jgi:hypothetical protein